MVAMASSPMAVALLVRSTMKSVARARIPSAKAVLHEPARSDSVAWASLPDAIAMLKQSLVVLLLLLLLFVVVVVFVVLVVLVINTVHFEGRSHVVDVTMSIPSTLTQ